MAVRRREREEVVSLVRDGVVALDDLGRADSRSWRSMPRAVRRPSMTRSL